VLSEIAAEVRESVEKTTISVKTLAGEIAANSKTDNVAQTERIRVIEESVKLMKHYTDFLGDSVKNIQTNLSKKVSMREESVKKFVTAPPR